MAAGFTVIPNIILERQKALGLDPLDVNILVYLSTYWWTADGLPRPSKKTIAEAVGRDPRTVQRRIAAMEAGGLIKRIERRESPTGSKPNEYSFDGLIQAAKPYAREKIEERAATASAKAARAARKGKPKLKLVKDE
ncbi:MAG: hypothetical protein ACR2O0_07280 [Rhizobiaceae bacterium]